jgi:hypothetical protein
MAAEAQGFAGRQPALAGDGRKLEGRVLRNDREVLVLRDFSQPDHTDAVLLHANAALPNAERRKVG